MNFIVNLVGDLKPICLNLNSTSIETIGELKQHIEQKYGISRKEQKLMTYSGKYFQDTDRLITSTKPYDYQICNLTVSVLGGKGGFGSMLRAQGGRMSSKKTTNFESCRDLQGRRLKTINDATKLVEYLNKEPERKRKRKEETEKKIEEGLKEKTKKRHRFDDIDYIHNHEKIMENVKDAISQACLKGLKKDKGKGKEKEKEEIKSLGIWDNMDEYDLSESESDSDSNSDTENNEEVVTSSSSPSSSSSSSPSKKVEENKSSTSKKN